MRVCQGQGEAAATNCCRGRRFDVPDGCGSPREPEPDPVLRVRRHGAQVSPTPDEVTGLTIECAPE